MSSTRFETPVRPRTTLPSNGRAVAGAPDVGTAAHQAFWLLRVGFTVAPILFGLDKSSTGASTGPTTWPTGSTRSSRSQPAKTSCTLWARSRSQPGSLSPSRRGSARS